MKKLFTLIELIVVIVILGVLAAIVIPNISSFKEDAKETAIKADTRNIQTAVDMFMLDHNMSTPTDGKPLFGEPKIIQLYGLETKYLRSLPDMKNAKFWLDYAHIVWSSTVDAPTGVEYVTGKLAWNPVENATHYKIYSTEMAKIPYIQ